MRAVILQPVYLPWLGFFDQLYQSDVFVIYDDVQYDRRGWRNRNRIKARTGPAWLTVPVLCKGRFDQLIRDTRVDASFPWQRKHLRTIRANYARAPYFDVYYPGLERIVQRPWAHLLDLDVALLEQIRDWLGLERSIRLASEVGGSGRSTERLCEICKILGATEYLTGGAARSYLDESLFAATGARVRYHNYAHPVYRQRFGPFVSHLSVIDLLFNCGPESLSILVGQSGAPAAAQEDSGFLSRRDNGEGVAAHPGRVASAQLAAAKAD